MLQNVPSGIVRVILILAPLILGLSIAAHRRLLGLVIRSPEPVVAFRNMRWSSGFIVIGGVFLLWESLVRSEFGSLTQVCGLVLAAEFVYVARANLRVIMSSGGLLLGMSYSPWRRFSGYEWLGETELMIQARSRRLFRVKVPAEARTQVHEIVDLNILR